MKLVDETIESTGEVAQVIKFYADWCGPCKMLKPQVIAAAKEATDITFMEVNIDEQPKVAELYGVMGLPTMILFGMDGQEIARHTGFLVKEKVLEFVNKAR